MYIEPIMTKSDTVIRSLEFQDCTLETSNTRQSKQNRRDSTLVRRGDFG